MNRYNYTLLSHYKLKLQLKHSQYVQHSNIKPKINDYCIDLDIPITKDSLPSTIETLRVYRQFNHSLQYLSSLKYLIKLEFGDTSRFNESLDHCLPSSLQRLIFYAMCEFNQEL